MACPCIDHVVPLSVSALEDRVADEGVYMWSQQSRAQSGGCCFIGDRGERRWELHLLALPPAALLALPPDLCEPSRSSDSSLRLSHPMTRAASTCSLFILVSACAVEKTPLAVSPAEHLDSLFSNCFSFLWVAKPLKQAEELAVTAFTALFCYRSWLA